MKFLSCAILSLMTLAASCNAMPELHMGTQVSVGYSNVVATQLLKTSKGYSDVLARSGFIPVESFANATVNLSGQSAHPGGYIRSSCCEYEFQDGALIDIRRRDLFEDKGPASLILRHLTNEVLTLKTGAAAHRALDLLKRLSYDADAIEKAYKIRVHDDLMDGSPVREGGPNFPKDLHFFGELISRKKIHLFVEFTPKNPAALANSRKRADLRVEFLATTGEMLEVSLAAQETMDALGIRSPAPLPPVQAPDFTPPLFFAASRKIAIPPAMLPTNDVLALLQQCWRALQQQVGTNTPQCYLLCDNLNMPGFLAQQFGKFAQNTPWAGASHFWRSDLPFDRALLNQLSRNRRGLELLAICGRVQTKLDVIQDLPDIPFPRNGDKVSQARFAKDRERLLPGITGLLRRMAPPAGPLDNGLFLLQATPNFASRVVSGEMESRAHLWQVFDATGTQPYNSVGEGVTYYNGAALTNALVLLRLSGSLPLRMDPSSLLRRMPEHRIISSEVSAPITELAYSFGPHPMQELFDLLGPGLISLLQHADRVEVFRVKSNTPNDWSVSGRANLEGHEIIAHSKPQGPDFAARLAMAILNEKNVIGVGSDCIFAPRDAFRIWRGKESATLLICFECDRIQIKHYDLLGKLVREATFGFGQNQEALTRLTRQALPGAVAPKREPKNRFE